MKTLFYNTVFVGIVRLGLVILGSIIVSYFIIEQFISTVRSLGAPHQDVLYTIGQLIGLVVVTILFVLIILYQFLQSRADFRRAVYQSRIKRVLSIAIFVIVEGGVIHEFRWTDGELSFIIDGIVFVGFLLLILNDIGLIFDKRNKETKEILETIDNMHDFEKNQ